ncbi:ABC transporter permease [bacterium]|nr:ABC transporter permease [candidate division CSSED10-310 bacterium]
MFWIVLRKELLSFFRDKNTIIYSIILPIALYPIIFWIMNELMTLHYGSLRDMPSRIAVSSDVPEDMVLFLMKSDLDLEISSIPLMMKSSVDPELKKLDLDVVIRRSGCSDEDPVEVFFDSSSDRSNSARDRIESVLTDYRIEKLNQSVNSILENGMEIRLIDIDLASQESRSRFLLGILLPMIVVIITVMGGIHPSIEVITSERERKTLETTLVSPVSATGLILGKFVAVITMSVLAGILNIIAMILTLRYTLFGGASDNLSFSIPLSTLPLMLIGIVLIAATFNALMILIAAFAKDFKEAQSYVSPVYAIGIQPAVVAAIPGIPFNSYTALIPITNISLFFRSLIQGNIEWIPTIITLTSLLVWCVILLTFARRLLRRDALVLGLEKQQIKSIMFGNRFKKGE